MVVLNTTHPATAKTFDPERHAVQLVNKCPRFPRRAITLLQMQIVIVLYLGALPELSVSFLREQGFRTAWKDDPREVHFLYANSYEREAAAQLFEKWLETHPMPQALFTTSFALLQGVMDVTLRRDGKLPSDLAIATFGDNELLDFLQCPVLAVAQRHRDVAERVLEIVLASLDEPRKPKPGLTRIKRNLYRRGVLSRS